LAIYELFDWQKNNSRCWLVVFYFFVRVLINKLNKKGYGVAGNPDDNSGPWYIQSNLDNRIRDGLGAVTIAGPPRSPTYRPNIC